MKDNNERALILGKTLDQATGNFLENNKSPSRKVNELDNRGSHYYLALYWANALAAQDNNTDMQSKFKDLAKALAENEDVIIKELSDAQGEPMDIGGYYKPDEKLVEQAMRPSQVFNTILQGMTQ